MLFSWLRTRRRRTLLAQPFPPDWLPYLQRNVPYYAYLTPVEQAKLRDDLRVFIAEKDWEAIGGLHITDEIKVTVAAQAMLLVLAIPHDYYARVPSVIIAPRGYVVKGVQVDVGGGLVLEEDRELLGETISRGPVKLSWSDVLKQDSELGSGNNLVFHEFAHQLDLLDGEINGTPLLRDRRLARRWQKVMTAEYEQLVRAAERGRATLLDDYGADNPGEFFAVATECFFDQPVALSERHPKLYELLRDFFQQDPAARLAARQQGSESP